MSLDKKITNDIDMAMGDHDAIPTRSVPELLAPAGTKEAFIAAVESGADAVYCGGKLFNARIGAGNFDDEEMSEAIAFAHKRGVKVHVTINTLIKDSELLEALRYCEKIYAMGADAIIIQDLGLAWLVNRNLPGMEIHMSTQGTIYNLDGVKAAAKLGFDRVVLARELSLDEIKEITEGIKRENIRPVKFDIDGNRYLSEQRVAIETFCHGAICMCYSGQCQLSRYIGGRSGNRGGCAQPCRLPYRGDGNKKGDYYPLSPGDLSLIDHLKELADAGVSSLKIEGRMKSPEYVGTVTSIYRKYLEELRDRGTYRVAAEDRLELLQIFNRGFTEHHLKGYEDEKFLSGDLPKNRGIEVGRVVEASKDKPLVSVCLTGEIQMGDTIEIRGEGRRVSVFVTYLSENDQVGTTIIGDVKGEVLAGDKIYRISSKEQLKRAEKYYRGMDWHQGKYNRRLPVEIEVWEEGGVLNALAKVDDYQAWVNAGPFEEKSQIINERIGTAMRKVGNTPFGIRTVDVIGDISLEVSMAELNALRRELLKKLETSLGGRRDVLCTDWQGIVKSLSVNADEPVLEIYFYNYEDYKKFGDLSTLNMACNEKGVKMRVLLPWEELENLKASKELSKGNDIPEEYEIAFYADAVTGKDWTRDHDFGSDAKKDFVYAGNIGQVETFKNAGFIPLYDYGVNVYNEASIAAMKELGAQKGMPSLEVDNVYFGALPLMTMEHVPEDDFLIDRKGAEYKVVKRHNHKTMLVPNNMSKVDFDYFINRAKDNPIRVFIRPGD